MNNDRCPARISHGMTAYPCQREAGHTGLHKFDSLIGELTWSGPEVRYGDGPGALTDEEAEDIMTEPDVFSAWAKYDNVAIPERADARALVRAIVVASRRIRAEKRRPEWPPAPVSRDQQEDAALYPRSEK